MYDNVFVVWALGASVATALLSYADEWRNGNPSATGWGALVLLAIGAYLGAEALAAPDYAYRLDRLMGSFLGAIGIVVIRP